jgi:hypothetical protein
MIWASAAQLPDQQLWNSLRRRMTSLEFAGVSRLIFDLAAAYAVTTSGSAKYGCCAVADSELWHPEQFAVSTG